MINLDDIQSLTDFKRHHEIPEGGRKGRHVPTVNGRAEIAVQDAKAYQEMIERVERAETVALLGKGSTSLREARGGQRERH